MTKVQMVKVEADDDGIRLDRWFKRHYPDLTFSALAKMIRKGQVRVDGKKVQPGDRVEEGAEIRVPPIGPAPNPRPAKPELEPLSDADKAFAEEMILHIDEAVIVLNKPAGLATQGGSGVDMHVDRLSEALKFGYDARPKLAHRLDKDTSGVLILGRTAGATAKLTEAFRHRDAEKLYWALLKGVPAIREGKIVLALEKRAGPHGDKMEAVRGGKPARTLYRVVDNAGQRASWVEFQPLSGRMHQLRVHAMSGLGIPIVGDGKYGGAEAFLTGGISRKLHLHARSLTIAHPLGGELSVTAPMPKHMAESWNMLAFNENDA